MINRRSGFTLIELLVVLVVLGILFTLGLFLFNDVRDSGHNTSARADVRASLMKATSGYVQNRNSFGASTAEAITQLEALDADGLSYTSSSGDPLEPRQIFVQLDDSGTGYNGPVGQQITLCSQSQATTPEVYCMRSNQEQAFPISESGTNGTATLVNTRTNMAYSRGPNIPDAVCALPQPGTSFPFPWPPAGCSGVPSWGLGPSGPVGIEAFTIGSQSGNGELGRNSTAPSATEFVAVYTDTHLADKVIDDIDVGTAHMCAVAENEVFCWGTENGGRLGNGSTSSSSLVPIPVVDTLLSGKEITKVSVGHEHSCAIADGDLFCWGRNDYGQLGDTTTSLRSSPVEAVGDLAGKTVTDVSAGVIHTCAVADGEAHCWGWGGNGRLGTGGTAQENAPATVFAGTGGALEGRTVTQISAQSNHTCAVADGAAYCWGAGNQGRLGNNSTSQQTSPVAVNTDVHLNGRTITDLAANFTGACVVADGAAYCWGAGSNNGTGTGDQTLIPLPVDTSGGLAGKTVTSVTGGSDSYAIADGELFVWGGTAVFSYTPIPGHPFADSAVRPIIKAATHSANSAVIAATME